MLDLAAIVTESIVDGPGLRVTLFSQGCPHRCDGCHNPETWEFGTGTPMEERKLLEIIRGAPLCRGVTFSGGEPFAQAGGFARLAELLKAEGYEVAAYTGCLFEQLLSGTPEQQALLRSLDVLIDGPFIQSLRSLDLAFRGSANQRILDVPKSLAAGTPIPVPPGRWTGEY